LGGRRCSPPPPAAAARPPPPARRRPAAAAASPKRRLAPRWLSAERPRAPPCVSPLGAQVHAVRGGEKVATTHRYSHFQAMYKRLIPHIPVALMPAFPTTRLFNTLDPQYLGSKQRLLQTFLQGLARLAAPELPASSPAEQRWVELLRQELLAFIHHTGEDGAESDG